MNTRRQPWFIKFCQCTGHNYSWQVTPTCGCGWQQSCWHVSASSWPFFVCVVNYCNICISLRLYNVYLIHRSCFSEIFDDRQHVEDLSASQKQSFHDNEQISESLTMTTATQRHRTITITYCRWCAFRTKFKKYTTILNNRSSRRYTLMWC